MLQSRYREAGERFNLTSWIWLRIPSAFWRLCQSVCLSVCLSVYLVFCLFIDMFLGSLFTIQTYVTLHPLGNVYGLKSDNNTYIDVKREHCSTMK
jgi:hypothetical protein